MSNTKMSNAKKRALREGANKVLSIILSVAMVLQTSPVAYARMAEDPTSVDATELVASGDEQTNETQEAPATTQDESKADEENPQGEVEPSSSEVAPDTGDATETVVEETVVVDDTQTPTEEQTPTQEEEAQKVTADLYIYAEHATIDVAGESFTNVTTTLTVPDDADLTVTVTPDENYELKDKSVVLTAGGLEWPQDTSGSYTITTDQLKAGAQFVVIASKIPQRRQYVYEDNNIKVIAELDAASAIPDDAELQVVGVTEDSYKNSVYKYNYDAYMDALNNAAGASADDPAYTADNTLLYDVAFMGYDLETNSWVEYQPEEGAVTVRFEFKKHQLDGYLGAEEAADVDVVHLPVKEEAKAATTYATTNISADDVVVEQIADENFGAMGTNTVEVKAEAFSVFAVTLIRIDGKDVYLYEDDNIKVTATLEKPEAIPDEADFRVKQITENIEGYAYDAYMEALNDQPEQVSDDLNSKDAEGNEWKIQSDQDKRYTNTNTLLYDIGFFVIDKASGKEVEIQPEEGSVTLDIQFKSNQLTDGIGINSAEDLSVSHLKLKDDIRSDVSTTEEATSITANDLEIENQEISSINLAGIDSVEMVVDSFSVWVWNNHTPQYYTVPTPNPNTFEASSYNVLKGELNPMANFGLIAFDTLNSNVHTNSNFVTKHLNGSTTFGTNNYPNAEVYYIGESVSGNANYNMKDSNGKYNGSIIVFGKNIPAGTIGNVNDGDFSFSIDGNSFQINGTSIKNENTKVIFQENSDTKYIDLDSWKTKAEELSTRFSSFSSTQVEKKSEYSSDKFLIVERSNTTVASFNLKGSDITNKKLVIDNSGVTVPENGSHVLIINLDLAGYTDYTLNGLTIIGSDTTQGEVSTWSRGNVIVNVIDSSEDDGLYKGHLRTQDQVSALILAPDAEVTAGGNVNGEIIANVINIAAEFHRDSFTFTGSITIKGGLRAAKRLDGSSDLEDYFDFELRSIDGAPMPLGSDNGVLRVKNETDGKILFGYIDFPEDTYDATTHTYKSYKYEIKEVIPDNATNVGNNRYLYNGIIYDATVYTVEVQPGEGENGGVGIVSYKIYKGTELVDEITYEQGKSGIVEFDNKTSNNNKVKVFAKKSFDGWGTTDFKNKEFTLELTKGTFTKPNGVTENRWMPDVYPSEIKLSKSNQEAEWTLSFNSFTDNDLGTYHYTLREKIPSNAQYSSDGKTATYDGIVYDATSHDVSIQISKLSNGTYQADVKYDNKNQLIVTNRVKTTDITGSVTLKAKKSLAEGSSWPTGGNVVFRIARKSGVGNESAPLPSSLSTDALTSVGEKSFGTISFGETHKNKTYYYVITENATGFGSGWTASPSSILAKVTVGDVGQDGKLHPTVTYSKDNGQTYDTEASYYTITNTYGASSAKGEVKAKKVLSGREWKATDSFKFTIEPVGNAPAFATNEVTITAADANADYTKSFGEVEFDAEGTYEYTVTEEHAGDTVDGVTYAGAKTVTFKVKDNGSGQLVADGTELVQTKAFTNTYGASGSIQLLATKSLANKTLAAGQFSFELKSGDETLQTKANGADGKATFSPIAVGLSQLNKTVKDGDQIKGSDGQNLAEGTKYAQFTYTISEVQPTGEGVTTDADGNKVKDGITYDKSAKTVTVTVSDKGDGTLDVSYGGSATYAGAEFINTYKVYEDLEVTKNLTGIDWNKVPDGFTFMLEGVSAKNGDQDIAGGVPMPAGANGNTLSKVLKPAANDDAAGQKTLKFGDIAFVQEGEYKYTITETVPSDATNAAGKTYAEATAEEKAAGGFVKNGITYDGTPYEVVINVKKDGNGTLQATVTYNNAASLTVTNAYKAEAELEVTKTLKNFNWGNATDGFNFKLTPANTSTPMPGNVATKTINVKGKGTAPKTGSFGKIYYTEAGTYIYTIQEIAPDNKIPGVVYDETAYTAEVSVARNANTGKLEATVVYKNGDQVIKTGTGESAVNATSLPVTNEFKSVSKALEVTKIYNRWTDKVPNGGFEFTLTADNGSNKQGVTSPMPTSDLTGHATADDAKVVTFGTVTYDTVGEYHYTITETVPADATNADGKAYNEATAAEKAAGGFEKDGITYDSTAHSAVVKVEADSANNNALKATVIYDGNQTALNVTNNFADATQNISATKAIDDWGKADSFTFRLTPGFGGKGIDAPMPAEASEGKVEKTVNCSEAKDDANKRTVNFGSIRYTKAGTYRYTVQELAGNADGVSYDKTPYEVIVTVSKTEDGKGLVAAAPVYKVGGKDETSLTITNTYAGAEKSLKVEKIFGDWTKAPSTGFEFVLEAKASSLTENGNAVISPMPNDTGVANNKLSKFTGATSDTKTIDFGTITFPKEGTYNYTITEVDGHQPGVTYNTTPIEVAVTVTKGAAPANTLTVTSIKYNDGVNYNNTEMLAKNGTLTPAQVSNTFADTTATVEVTKAINVWPAGDNGKFNFELAAGTNNAGEGVATPMPEGTEAGKNATAQATSDKHTATFNAIHFEKVGVYHYTLTEIKPANAPSWITYNTTPQDVTITVAATSETDNTLVATVAYAAHGDKASVKNGKLTLTNAYDASGELKLEGLTKKLEGRTATEADVFNFKLYEVTTDKDNNEVLTEKAVGTSNPSTGAITFNPTKLNYSLSDLAKTTNGVTTYEAKTFSYRIIEAIPADAKNAKGERYGEATDKSGSWSKNGVTYTNKQINFDVTVSDNGTGTLQVSPNNTNTLSDTEFVNNYGAKKSLVIKGHKTIDAGTRTDLSGFKFQLTATDSAYKPLTGDAAYSNQKVTDANGNISFDKLTYEAGKEVAPNSSADFYYQITEVDTPAGYKAFEPVNIKVTVTDNGTGSLTIATTPNMPEAGYTLANKHEATGSVTFAGTKSIDVRDLAEGDNFTFSITEKHNNQTKTLYDNVSMVTTGENAGKINYPTITYKLNGTVDQTGDYEYTITENVVSKTGITTSSTEHKVTVNVSDAGADSNELAITKSNNFNKLDFVNTYETSTTATLGGTKLIDIRDWKSTDAFTFNLVEVTDAQGKTEKTNGVKRTQTVQSADAKAGQAVAWSFDPITYVYNASQKDNGTHYYKVTEAAVDINGITKDAREYVVSVNVTYDRTTGTLTATPSAEATALAFTNKYEAKTYTTLGGTKLIDKRDWQKTDAFTFNLVEVVSDAKDAAEKEGGITRTQTVKSETAKAGEKVNWTFPVIEYVHNATKSDAGTHYYKVTESAIDAKGIKSDTRTYIVTVEVTYDEAAGTLTATASDNATKLDFENKYTAKGDLTLTGTKVMDGRAFQKGDEYTFTVTADKAKAPMPKNNPVTINPTSGNEAEVVFGKINYTLADKGEVYTYTVTETGTIDGVAIDAAKTFKVRIDDNGDGTLKVVDENQKVITSESVKFTNKFTAAKATLQATKQINDWGTADHFTFTLAAVDGAPMPEGAKDGKLSKQATEKNRTATFGTIAYGKAGTYKYTITEADEHADGVTYDTTDHEVIVEVKKAADNSLSATVTYDGKDALVITNTYESNKATLQATKSFNDWGKADSFEFVLANKNDAPMPADAKDGKLAKTVTKNEPTAVFGEIEYKKAGDYSYTITETKGDADGVTYDTKAHEVLVKVTKGDDNKLTTNVTYDGEDSLIITNTYAATKATIEATKEFNDWGKASEFIFDLAAVTKDAPMPTQTFATAIKDAPKAAFDAITYEKTGVYEYTLTERNGSADGVSYDTTPYKVVVSVTKDADNKMSAKVTYGEKGDDSLTITNTYTSVKATIEVTKDFEDWGKANEFNFDLAAVTKDAPMPASPEAKATEKNPVASFGEIEFTKAGTYNYTITERNDGADGVTYDTRAHNVTVEVTRAKNATNKLTAAVTYEGADSLTITNTYKATSANLEVTKDFNDWGKADSFTFKLKPGNSTTPMPLDKDGKAITTAIATKDAKTASFGAIVYEKAGTYNYTISEVNDGVDGVSYDTTEHKVVVTVAKADDATNALTATVTYDGEKALVITNTYTATKATIEATKDFNDWGKAKSFTFNLAAVTEGAPMPDDSTATATKDEPLAKFAEITFEKAGRYEYKLTEANDGVDGVTYDSAEHKVVVNVAKATDATNKLTATVTYDGKDSLTITNTYAAVKQGFEVTKKLTGRAWTETDAFDFTLAAVTAGAPLPENPTLTATSANKTVKFDEVSFEAAGTYEYTITEEIPAGAVKNADGTFTLKGVTYDPTPHKVKVTVTKADVTNKLSASVTYDGAESLTVTNTYAAADSINVKVTKSFDNGAHWPAGKSFRFTIQALTDGAPKPAADMVTATAQAPVQAFGTLSFTQENLKDAEGKMLASRDFSYRITELDLPAGAKDNGDGTYTYGDKTYKSVQDYKVTVADNGDGTLSVTADGAATLNAQFVNAYEAEGSITFEGTKTLENAKLKADQFSFAIYYVEGETKTMLGEAFGNTADGKIKYPTIVYSLEDLVDTDGNAVTSKDFTYEVKEETADGDGVTVDTKVYTVGVHVEDNGDGTLSVTRTDKNDKLDFVNTYHAEGTLSLDGLVKDLTGRGMTAADVFTFEVTDNGTKIATGTNDVTGKITFDKPTVTYTQADAGTHEIVISEVVPAKKDQIAGVDYSAEPITALVNVTDDGKGTLTVDPASLSVLPNVKLTNGYHAKATAQIEANKTLDGMAKELTEGLFSFTLTQVDEDGKALTGDAAYSNVAHSVASEDATTKATFDTLTYTQDSLTKVAEEGQLTYADGSAVAAGTSYGEFYYSVIENVPAAAVNAAGETYAEAADKSGEFVLEGITYAEQQQIVKITVIDRVNGTLEVSYERDGKAVKNGATNFVNKYFETTGKIEFDKDFYGSADDYAFTFKVTPADANGNALESFGGTYIDVDAAQKLVYSGTSGFTKTEAFTNGTEKRSIEIPEIHFYEPGTYYYLITEVVGTGLVYDESTILVTIDANTKGTAKVSYKMTDILGEDVKIAKGEKPTFFNNELVTVGFRAAPLRRFNEKGQETAFQPEIRKVLENGKAGEYNFTFCLYEGKVGGTLIDSATNDENGVVQFDAIRYSEPGTYEYVITELDENAVNPAIIYSKQEVKLTVTVTKDGDNLNAVGVYSVDGVETTDPTITNNFDNVRIVATKYARETLGKNTVVPETLEGATYGLWMVVEGGNDVYMGNSVSDKNGELRFDIPTKQGVAYYLLEEEAPAGRLIDPYPTDYFTLVIKDGTFVLEYESEYGSRASFMSAVAARS